LAKQSITKIKPMIILQANFANIILAIKQPFHLRKFWQIKIFPIPQFWKQVPKKSIIVKFTSPK
jgi:hypothetical protein